jgi:hypothetical protein
MIYLVLLSFSYSEVLAAIKLDVLAVINAQRILNPLLVNAGEDDPDADAATQIASMTVRYHAETMFATDYHHLTTSPSAIPITSNYTQRCYITSDFSRELPCSG